MGLKTLLNNIIRIYLPLLLAMALILFFNPTIGIVSGITLSLIAGAYELWRYKKINIYLLSVIGAILITSALFYWLKNTAVANILPLMLEFLILSVLMLMNHKNNFINEIMIKRRAGKELITHTYIELYIFCLRVLIVLLAIHLVLSLTAYTLNNIDLYQKLIYFGFFTTIVVYIVFVSTFFIYRKNQLNHVEWLTVVDAKGGVKGKATRKHCHGQEKLMHPVVHLHLLKGNSIYLQKRPENKDIQPGKWDTAVGGHISFGEDIETGLNREANEELGLINIQPRFLLKYVWETQLEKELVYTFYVKDIDEITINKSELADGKYWSVHQIRENLGKGVFTPNFEKEFELLSNIFFS